MTAFPLAATKTHLDGTGDDPKQARAELAVLVDLYNQLRTHISEKIGSDDAENGVPVDGFLIKDGEPYIGFDAGKTIRLLGVSGSEYGKALQVNALGTGVELVDSVAQFGSPIINGAMQVWQRGAIFNLTGSGFSADRYLHLLAAGDALTVSREDFAPGQTDIPGEPEFFMRMNKTASGGVAQSFRQRIEDVRTFAGETVVLSYYARTSSDFAPAAISLRQSFGSGGSADANFNIGPVPTYTNSWQRFEHVVNLGSLSGKVIGEGNCLDIYWTLPDSTWDLDIYGVQLNRGSKPGPFIKRPVGLEEVLCQRYFVRCGVGQMGTAHGTTVVGFGIRWPRRMRAAPIVTLNTSTPVIYQQSNGTKAGVGSTIVAGGATTVDGCHFALLGFTGLIADSKAVTLFSNLLDVDAEL